MPNVARFLIFIFSLYITGDVEASTKSNPTIAIIGAGVGGASTAHYLRELFGASSVIDIYEKGRVGGRLATVEINGQLYDSGATVLHPSNIYSVNFLDVLGLKKREKPENHLGVFDGQQMVFHSSSSKVITVAQMLWRYGWSTFKINSEVKETLDDFANIYKWHDEGVAFTTVENLLGSMSPGFIDLLNVSIAADMQSKDHNDAFIRELVRGAMLSNYGQDIDNLHGFVGAVSMAGVQPGLWSVHGGNNQIPEKLIEKSGAKLYQEEVVRVSLLSDSSVYEVETKQRVQLYDIVILACPLVAGLSEIKFENFPKPISVFSGRYHQTVATFVKGKVNASYFGFKSESQLPSALFLSNPDLTFNSLGKQEPVNFKKNDPTPRGNRVWKIFSKKPQTDTDLSLLFTEIDEVQAVDWLAYPHYKSRSESSLTFELYTGLYHVNSIEWAASAVEMSVLAARNVALLARHRWFEDSGHIDQYATVSDGSTKAEL